MFFLQKSFHTSKPTLAQLYQWLEPILKHDSCFYSIKIRNKYFRNWKFSTQIQVNFMDHYRSALTRKSNLTGSTSLQERGSFHSSQGLRKCIRTLDFHSIVATKNLVVTINKGATKKLLKSDYLILSFFFIIKQKEIVAIMGANATSKFIKISKYFII